MFDRILVAVDLNDLSGAEIVAGKAAELAKFSKAELHVLNVVPSMGMALVGSAFGTDHANRMVSEAQTALNAWAKTSMPDGVTAIHVTQGTIYDQILRTADTLKADAIVVGAHSPELRDYLVGPNAARVVRHAKQAVLVIR